MESWKPNMSQYIDKMPEGRTAEYLLNGIMESIADNVPKKKSVSFFEEEKSNSVSSKLNRLFGRQKPVHHLLGGGKSPGSVPRVVIPNELFVNIGSAVGFEVNRALGFLQAVACGGNLKQFLIVVASLWAAAMIGSWCNFLTVFYIGFVAAHTLPVLYEKNEDQVDGFVDRVLGQFQKHYKKLDAGFLSKIPKGNLKGKKFE
ncbi:Reticulon [Dillenia turbinata]|uniref:Reticulon-like protein n=1 Tax=Dillenia turbinata TaxID=194707 RepID=A0AAN8UFP9_9MAGN